MWKFIRKTSLFLLILGIILGTLNYKYVSADTYQHMNNTYKFSNIPEDIEVAHLGNSHGMYAFVYDDIDKTSFSFAMPAQRLYYDYKLLERHIDNFAEDATLFIPVSYISFYLGYDNENFEEFNKMYYRILPFRDIKNPKIEDYLKYSLLPILTADSNIKYAFIENEDFEPAREYMNYSISPEEMKAEGLATGQRHLDFIREGQKNKDEFVLILDEIIALALENNIKPVVLTSPLSKYYNSNFSNEFYKDFTSTIENIIEKNPGSLYLDYSHDSRFTNSPEYFFDSGHLNITGGKKFTNIIMEDTKKAYSK